MKYLKQFGIILGITFVGEILKAVLPFPIPAGVYGLVLMFMVLKLGIISIEKVQDTATFLIEIMPLMFIPAAAGLMDSWGMLKPIFLPFITITVVSTVVVMVATGKMTDLIIGSEGRKSKSSSTQEENSDKQKKGASV